MVAIDRWRNSDTRWDMDSFRWDSSYVTGLAEVDAQHRHLVEVINRFGELLLTGEAASADAFAALFRELAEYAQYHFSEEEREMARMQLDARHVETHRKEHDDFLADAGRIYRNIPIEEPGAGEPLLKFLVYWLSFHILGSDQAMARQIESIGEGKSPAEAYAAAEHLWAGPNEPLLTALTGLFHQLSSRNRELAELNRTLEERVLQRTHELAEANRKLELLSLTDVLTGLPNRRHAMQSLESMWQEALTRQRAFACMMIDADGFKQINDSCGHDAGDIVLRELAHALADAVRSDDLVCRLGGDEFLILCPNTPLSGAQHLAEQIRKTVAQMRVAVAHGEWVGSISIGVAARTAEMRHFEELIKAADEGVYRAKRNGRNCVATR